jgi:dethiobiotin synthetase
MSRVFVVAGTDTGVGKTVFAAALAGALDGFYWKPIQAGLGDSGDCAVVRSLSGLPADRMLPEAYRLAAAASPHRAAEIDGLEIDTNRLEPPRVAKALLIELAGGLLVPLTHTRLQIDVVAGWSAPIVLVARTALGTINHSLLSIEALRRRSMPIHGIAFIGEAHEDSESTICRMGGVRRLGRLPRLDPLEPGPLREAFAAGFRIGDFT